MFDIISILVNSFESQLLKIVKNLYLETKSYRHKIIWEPFYVCLNSRCFSTSLHYQIDRFICILIRKLFYKIYLIVLRGEQYKKDCGVHAIEYSLIRLFVSFSFIAFYICIELNVAWLFKRLVFPLSLQKKPTDEIYLWNRLYPKEALNYYTLFYNYKCFYICIKEICGIARFLYRVKSRVTKKRMR